MKNIFSHSKTPSPSVTRSPSPTHQTFGESLMEDNLETATTIINKWNTETSPFAAVTSLFSDRREANDILKSVQDLQVALDYFVSKRASSDKIVHAQNLMQIAMRRLQKEFYQILSTNRDQLDPESISGRSSHASERSRTSTSDNGSSSDDEAEIAGDSINEVSTPVMSDLRLIAEIMISSGYGKECVKIYKVIRKSIVDEGLYKLGVEHMTPSQIQKMEWEVLELKIKQWLHAVKIAVKSFFDGERTLCDHVFSTSESIRESCFAEISKEAAITLFSFPELVAKGKKSPEKMFRILDLYDAISELWPQIESIFSFESTSAIRSQALSSLLRLGDSVRAILTDFESAIQKDWSKTPVPGGGIHPLTRYVMNYLGFLSDYSGILSELVVDMPLPVQTTLPDSYLGDLGSDEVEHPAIAIRFAWLVLVLLCKLDGKTELYKEVSLSYLFLANNLQYVISKVRASNLSSLLGEDWISKNEMKVKQYIANYERMGWSKVMGTLPDSKDALSIEEVKQHFQRFSSAFEAAYRTQSSWVVSDGKLRDEIKVSVCKKLVPAYQVFYEKYRAVMSGGRNFESLVRFSPEYLGNYLSDLFYGTGVSGSSSGHSSSKGSPSR